MKEYSYKYTNSGKIGNILVENYFLSVKKLFLKIPLDFLKKKDVLEVGCGPGFSSQRILKYLHSSTKFYVSDYEKENVIDAKNKLGKRVIVDIEDVYNLKRKSNSMSLIFLLEVLEHLEEPSKGLTEIRRVGSKYFIFGVPREPIWRVFNMLRGKYLKDFGNTPGHLHHWTKFSFKQFIEKNGFRVLAIESPLPWTIILAEKKDD